MTNKNRFNIEPTNSTQPVVNEAPQDKVLSKEEANAILSEKVAEVERLLRECEQFADKHKLSISWDLAYGMGGWYEEGEWCSSTSSCS